MSPVHQVRPKPSCKAQWKGEEDKADEGRGEKTTSGNGQTWSSPSPRGQRRREKMEETGCEVICGAPTTVAIKRYVKDEEAKVLSLFFFIKNLKIHFRRFSSKSFNSPSLLLFLIRVSKALSSGHRTHSFWIRFPAWAANNRDRVYVPTAPCSHISVLPPCFQEP